MTEVALYENLSVLQKALERMSKDSDTKLNMGGLNFDKAGGREVYGYRFAQYLVENNGTIHWDTESVMSGSSTFSNIHQYLAAEIYCPSHRLQDRVNYGEEYEKAVRSGIATLDKWLLDKHDILLYRIQMQEGNRVTVITVDPNYVVAPGLIASAAFRERNVKTLVGQVASFQRKSGLEDGAAKRLVNQVVKEIDYSS